eukprot:736877-Pelagomonas_calceolata.AAC.3
MPALPWRASPSMLELRARSRGALTTISCFRGRCRQRGAAAAGDWARAHFTVPCWALAGRALGLCAHTPSSLPT